MITKELVSQTDLADLTASCEEIANYASYSVETREIPDAYYYLIDSGGRLVSPHSGILVQDSIDTNSYVRTLELMANQFIEARLKVPNINFFVWISPPDEKEKYPLPKVVVSELFVVEGKKVLFNTSFAFSADKEECVEIANWLARFSLDKDLVYTHEWQVRCRPLFFGGQYSPWHILSECIDAAYVWEIVESGEYLGRKKETLEQAKVAVASLRPQSYLQEQGLIGTAPPSCPMGLYDLFRKNSIFLEEFFKCPSCGGKITSSKSIAVCPHCGARKEDFATCI